MQSRHVLLATMVAAIWGFNFVTISAGLEDFPPLLFAALRFTAAALPAVFFLRRPPVAARWFLIVGLALGVGQFGLLFIAMHEGMPAGLSSLVLQTAALFTALFAGVLLHERLGRWQAAGMGVAFCGLTVLAVDFGHSSPLLAFALCIGAAVMWALANVGTRLMNQRTERPVDPLAFLVWMSLVPPIPLFGLSLIFEGPGAATAALTGVSLSGLGALAYIAYLATLVGFGCWGWLMRRYEAGTVAMYALLVPPFGMASAALVLGERITAVEILAAVLIIGGVALGSVRRAAPPSSPPSSPAVEQPALTR